MPWRPPTFPHEFPYEEEVSNLHHSPILGWAFDGYPIYGPYGYSNPWDPASPLERMETSYQPRTLSTRTALPGWAAQALYGENVPLDARGEYPLPPSQYGPAVSGAFARGRYAEDYEYVAGLGDLDKFNGRWTVTPEFPQGTYAYFVTIDALGTGVYPYTVGRQE